MFLKEYMKFATKVTSTITNEELSPEEKTTKIGEAEHEMEEHAKRFVPRMIAGLYLIDLLCFFLIPKIFLLIPKTLSKIAIFYLVIAPATLIWIDSKEG